LDFGILHDRLTASIEWYRQESHDLLYPKSLPATSGVPGTITVNDGKTRNTGMEFTLSADAIRPAVSTGFSWQLDANFTFNRNKVLALNEGRTVDETRGFFVGHPINVVYNYEKIGIWQLNEAAEAAKYGFRPGQVKILDYNNDGVINSSDRHVYGQLDPKFEGGLTSRMGFKNFDLTAVSFFRIGGTLLSQIHMGTSYLNMLQGRRNQIKVDYWTPWNPTNEYPMPDNTDQPAGTYSSTLGQYDAGFLKIRSISLGYNFEQQAVKNLGINALRLYATVQNPFVFFSDYMRHGGGVDPEGTNMGDTGNNSTDTGGIQARQIVVGLNTPPTRNFIFGLNITF